MELYQGSFPTFVKSFQGYSRKPGSLKSNPKKHILYNNIPITAPGYSLHLFMLLGPEECPQLALQNAFGQTPAFPGCISYPSTNQFQTHLAKERWREKAIRWYGCWCSICGGQAVQTHQFSILLAEASQFLFWRAQSIEGLHQESDLLS